MSFLSQRGVDLCRDKSLFLPLSLTGLFLANEDSKFSVWLVQKAMSWLIEGELLWLAEDAWGDIAVQLQLSGESLSSISWKGFEERLYKSWLRQQEHSTGRQCSARDRQLSVDFSLKYSLHNRLLFRNGC